MNDAKHCPYCGVAHDNRGRACCAEHRTRWRSIAMGRDVAKNLAAIFGDKAPPSLRLMNPTDAQAQRSTGSEARPLILSGASPQ